MTSRAWRFGTSPSRHARHPVSGSTPRQQFVRLRPVAFAPLGQ
ncbi:hypothetical protein [Streptomyces sp. NPDC048644]